MKKLTSGIFATLLTVVGVGAANAEIASKAYVDDKDTTITTRVETLENNLDSTISDAIDTAISADNGAIAGAIETAIEPVRTQADANKTSIETLNGAENVAGSVKKTVADAIATEAARSDAYADQAEKDAIAAAKTAGDAAYAVKATEDVANDASTNATKALNNIGTLSTLTTTAKGSAVAAINEVDAAAKKNAADITDINTTLENVATDEALTTLEGKVTTLTNTVNDTTSGLAATKSIADANKAAIENTTTGLAATKAIADANKSAIENATTGLAATKAIADAAKTTADKAIPAPTTECTNKGAKCVLTSGEAGYAWEVIARGTTE